MNLNGMHRAGRRERGRLAKPVQGGAEISGTAKLDGVKRTSVNFIEETNSFDSSHKLQRDGVALDGLSRFL